MADCKASTREVSLEALLAEMAKIESGRARPEFDCIVTTMAIFAKLRDQAEKDQDVDRAFFPPGAFRPFSRLESVPVFAEPSVETAEMKAKMLHILGHNPLLVTE